MPNNRKESESLGAGCAFWLLAILVWLVITYPWLLLFPLAIWLCIILPNRPKKVRRRPPPQKITAVPAPRTMVATPAPRTTAPAPPPKVIPPPVKTAPPDFIPKDREYNRRLARTWDEEFESLVKGASVRPEQHQPVKNASVRPEQHQPAENASVKPKQHQPVKGGSSTEHVLNEPDDEPARLRRAILARFHADVVKLHEARVAASREARVAHSRQDARQLLAGDPRTMWAWAEYVARRSSPPVRREDAQQVLAAIPPGDHVEIFGSACVFGGSLPPLIAKFAARTFDSWILPSSGQEAITIPAANSSWTSSKGGSKVDAVTESHFTLADGRHLAAYADQAVFDRFVEGAGRSILRLADNPLAPAPPQLGTGPMPSKGAPSGSASPGQYVNVDGYVRQGGDDALVADYVNSVTDRVHKAQANYGSSEASHALREVHGKARSKRARKYLKGAVDAVERHPRIGAETHKAVVSHFRNADLRAAFFCQVLGLPYPGDKPLSRRRRPPTAADFY